MGSSTTLNFFLNVLFIASFAQMAAGGGVDLFKPIDYVCLSKYKNFSTGSEYEKNLNFVLHDLPKKTPATGFAYEYAGVAENNTDFRVYGRAQCRGDVSAADCQICVAKIGRWIREKCPSKKAANAWFQGCLLKYSDSDFLGKMDDPKVLTYFIWKKQNISRIAPLEKVEKFLNHLEGKAYTSNKLFAKGVVRLAGSKNLYGLVQCTLDLSPADCKACIDGLISIVPKIYGVGTQLHTTTCTLQYLFYPFFNA